ncbi:DUF5995 family protein [Streptomyces sp. B-S-A8]|uniref:DUF5995 family protein n=1 Tax=Streptomyces solicavernae TaxID=3043614 RepID=A0ABT6RSR0_9ACTN|nr:DUF5995 family protein [Streptomyces sp. B-S-A8]MDI3386711.1 DUF5995 family protein [Streptomyces sp. B-S-A8]
MALSGQVGTGTVEAEKVRARERVPGGDRPRCDGVAEFHRAYLTVSVKSCGTEPAPLHTRLAERYAAALDSARRGPRPPAAWRPLFQYRHHPGVRPLQFALAGLNAHIGYDLALAVVDTCHALGCEPAAVEGEFDRAGDRLAALEEHILDDLAPGPDLLQIADPLTHLLGCWNLERARDAAWSAARVLWGLRELPDLAEEFRQRTDSGVGLVGHCLLTPWRCPPWR